MRSKYNILLILILLVAIFLRFNYDIFIKGYNYDEIAIMSCAVQSFPFGILKAAAVNDYHAPLYQLIAHFFTYFDQEWLYLRLFNLLLSIINVFIFYKIGKLLKNKTAGLVLALILAVNHFEITTVSFVKFYCLAFLLFSCSIYYLIKILKKEKGYIAFGIFNSAFILTSTLGFINVIIEFLFLFFFKKRDKNIIKSAFISSLGFLLYLPILIYQTYLAFLNIAGPHSYYSDFSLISLYNAFNDYFSPLINYCCNLITVESFSVFLKILKVKTMLLKIEYCTIFLVFSFIPVLINAILAVLAIKKDETIKKLNLINFSYLFIFIMLTKLSITGFIPIYLFSFAIILLISSAIGLSGINNKKIFVFLLLLVILPQVLFTNVYPPDKRGIYKAKIYYCYEKYFKEHNMKNTKIIATNGARFLKKYYKNFQIIDFDNEKMGGNFQKEYIELIFGTDFAKNISKKNMRNMVIDFNQNGERSEEFEKYFIQNVVNNTKKGEEIVLSFFNDDNMPFLANDSVLEKVYSKKIPYNYKLSKATIKEGLSEEIDTIDTSGVSTAIKDITYTYLIELLDKYFKRVELEQYTRDDSDDFILAYKTKNLDKPTIWYAKNCSKSWIFIKYVKE